MLTCGICEIKYCVVHNLLSRRGGGRGGQGGRVALVPVSLAQSHWLYLCPGPREKKYPTPGTGGEGGGEREECLTCGDSGGVGGVECLQSCALSPYVHMRMVKLLC